MSFLNVTFLDLFDFNQKSQLWKYIVKSCSKHFDPDKIWEYGFPYHKNLVHVIKDELLLELGVSTTRRVPFYMFYKAHAIMGRSSYFPRNNCQSGQDTMQLSTLWTFCWFLYISEYFFMIFDGIWKLSKGHYFMFCLKYLDKETFSRRNLFTIVNSCYLGYTISRMLLRLEQIPRFFCHLALDQTVQLLVFRILMCKLLAMSNKFLLPWAVFSRYLKLFPALRSFSWFSCFWDIKS